MSDERIFLLGGGGHGSVVLDALLSKNSLVAGIFDPAKTEGTLVFDIPILGGDTYLDRLLPSSVLLVNGVGVNDSVDPRAKLFDIWSRKGFSFLSVIHANTSVGRDCVLEQGAQLMSGAVLQCRVKVGINVVINTGASIDHDSVINAHAFVGPGAVLCGEVSIGAGAFIGAGATVLPGVRIGAGAIVGAGAVVLRDVDDHEIVVGNPAVTRTRKTR